MKEVYIVYATAEDNTPYEGGYWKDVKRVFDNEDKAAEWIQFKVKNYIEKHTKLAAEGYGDLTYRIKELPSLEDIKEQGRVILRNERYEETSFMIENVKVY